ncbi:phosphatidate cytidylyltransferase [Chitinophaga varians]|uniref:phosphatidate cytidylyltransferase n=1 Tax=Chitinophaga varians TaxID=2202339 RepID=UPI00165F57B3|nr:phosphatidate cytidylyltransferase [Chitinophaga varians]MBC9914780.1 phosphatidate cytidylyltransferase [Chitinophaga varians]
MKKLTSLLFVMMAIMMTSCEVVGGIFKAGVWTGIIIVALVIALIIWLISRGSRRN